jgi:hypothetical protein
MRLRRAGTLIACVVTGMALMTPALAARGSSEAPPVIQGEVIYRGGPAYVGPRVEARPAVLPLTGADVTLVAATGCAAIAAGAALARRARRGGPRR